MEINHPIQRFMNPKWHTNHVKGMFRNVFLFQSNQVNKYPKFAVALLKYLRMQDHHKEGLFVMTFTDVQSLEMEKRLMELETIPTNQVGVFKDFRKSPSRPEILIVLVGKRKDEDFAIRQGRLTEFSQVLNETIKRVRCGVFILGSAAFLAVDPQLQIMVQTLATERLIGASLPIKCFLHGTIQEMRTFLDFPHHGGCFESCGHNLICGHLCPNQCHFQDHQNALCFRSCGKMCPHNHPCVKLCHPHIPCPPCTNLMTTTLANCGHVAKYRCQESKPLECNEEGCELNYKCAHYGSQNAGKNCLEQCQERRQRCGHLVIAVCKEMRGKLQEICRACTKSCQRVGHECRAEHPCHEKCPPCREIIELSYAGCSGHATEIPCYQTDWPENKYCRKECNRRQCGHHCDGFCGLHWQTSCPPCTEIVTTRRTCGHEWTHQCFESEEAFPCEEIVNISDLSDCGHKSIKADCSRAAKVPPGQAGYFCDEICKFYFDPSQGGCGHTCTGVCKICFERNFHQPCQERCRKVLFCGHKCQSRCTYACPPCSEECEYYCDHGHCSHPCSSPCIPCEKSCTYSCPHGKCTAKCGEPCNKLPCGFHCPKRLDCGHSCAGYCGEPCPPLCTICDQDELLKNEFLGKSDIPQMDRFIFLEDCGHTIDEEGLVPYIRLTRAQSQIVPLCCPICQTWIRSCKRFGDALYESKLDLNLVRKRVNGDAIKIYQSQQKAAYTMSYNQCQKSLFPELFQRIVSLLFNSNEPGLGKKRFRHMSLQEAETMAFVAKIYRDMATTVCMLKNDISEADFVDLRTFLNCIEEFLLETSWPLTPFEMHSLYWENERIADMTHLLQKRGPGQPTAVKLLMRNERAQEAFTFAFNVVTVAGPYTTIAQELFQQASKILDGYLEFSLDISDKERKEIINAFDPNVQDSPAGRWFRCENKHIYVVTECGGVTEETLCPDCGAKIGGRSHSVLPTNQLATEMDGAIRPLFPTALAHS